MSTLIASTSSAAAVVCHGAAWGWWPIIPILWFLFVVFVVVMVARFGWVGSSRWYAQQWAGSGTQAGRARLAERFAAGEIDEQEYRARRAVLDESTDSGDQR